MKKFCIGFLHGLLLIIISSLIVSEGQCLCRYSCCYEGTEQTPLWSQQRYICFEIFEGILVSIQSCSLGCMRSVNHLHFLGKQHL